MDAAAARQQEHVRDMLRRFVRRGATSPISKLLSKLRPEDVATLMRSLTQSERLEVFRILVREYPDATGDVVTELEPHQRNELFERVGAEESARILHQMPVDDAVYVLDSLPGELREEVMEIVDLHPGSEMQAQLTYEDDTAGRIMIPEFFSLPESTPVRDAVAAIQENRDVELIFYLYIVDAEERLVGVTSLRQLLLAPPGKTLGQIAQRDVIKAHTGTDQEEVAQVAARYDLLAIPVVDEEDRLVGIVTVDDIVDIFKEEATEDFLKMVGTTEEEIANPERSLRVAGIRLPWLLINMVGLVISGLLLERFSVTFQEALFLLTFVPVIMGMGGNSGSQTSTITVRGLATGRLVPGQGRVGRFLWQQLKVGLVLGLALGLVVGVIAVLLEQNPAYAAVVGVSLFFAILTASLSGTLIPLAAQRLGIDPAIAAGPLVTTSNDIVGLLIYFGFAALLIRTLVP
ncbi:MAG TPA: magnesium transporter [Thermoanaerobaculia bacterium]|nr:magnesium transporter [Thermoanaerobaculia bacterium]